MSVIKLLEDAIEKVKALPEERQRYIARVLEQLTDDDEAVHQLTNDERRQIQEGIDDADAGRVVSEADMDAFWNRHRS